MRTLRLIVAFVLCIAIPLNALAALPSCVCPMEADHVATSSMLIGASDCCEQRDGKPDSAKPCKPGQSCASAGLPLMPSTQFQFSAPTTRIIHFQISSIHLDSFSSSIWRPPSLF